jgi:hypothetical protein
MVETQYRQSFLRSMMTISDPTELARTPPPAFPFLQNQLVKEQEPEAHPSQPALSASIEDNKALTG